MAFDENKYKSIFESRYGSGSYESGLANARRMGELKAQAKIAKSSYDDYMSEQRAAAKKAATASKKKTYTDALSYFNDPSVKEAIKKDGAYKIANDIKNDPQKQADIKAQGYNLDDYIDAMYSAASDGQYRSQREYSQYTKDLSSKTKQENKAKDKEYQNKYGMNYQDYYDTVQKPQQDAAKKKKTKPKESILGDLKNFFTSKDTNNDGQRDGLLGLADRYVLPISQAATEVLLPGNEEQQIKNDKAQNKGKITNPALKAGQVDRGTETKVLHGIGTALGYVAPYEAGYKAVGAMNLLPKIASKVTNPYAQQAIRGAVAGTIAEGGLAAENELVNPDANNSSDYAKRIAFGAAGGAIGDPLLHGLGNVAKNVFRKTPNIPPAQEPLLGLPGPQERLRIDGPQQPLALNAPQQALPAPRPVESTLNTFNNMGKMPTGLQSPIPQMPKPMEEIIPKKPVAETNPIDYKALEDAHVQEQLKPHYDYQKQAAEAQTKWQTTVSAAKDEISRIKESFGKIYVPKDALEDYQVPKQFLAGGKDTHSDDIFTFADQMGFSTPDEAVQYLKALDEESRIKLKDMMPSGQNMIPEKDLRYREEALRKEFRAKNPHPEPPKQEQTSLDIPQIAPEDRKVSRLATFDEMYQRMQETAPPKQEPKPLDPLEFRREKGYDLTPKIKNRGEQQATAAEKKSSLLLPLKPVSLKTVKTTKSVHTMNKNELQGVYQELKTKKETFTKNNNQKKIKQVDEDIKQVEGLLMKLDLQLFGKKAEKNIIPKLKAGGDAAKPAAENIKSAPKNPKQEYAISQSKNKKLVDTYKQKNDKLKEDVAKLLSNSDNWKDKGRFSLGRETMSRNFEDIMGKDADTFKQKFLDPISSQEANRVRFLNKERETVKAYGIKAKSEDDKLVQMYGEKKISLAELKQKTQNWKQVVKVSENYRRKYDQLLTDVNKVLEDNGFTPIPKRADYFPHYEEVDGIMKSLGFDMENHSLPTDINGLTDQFKPNKNFFRNALQRKGDETTFGAIQGFDKYIEGISNVIYHTKNIKQLRTLDQVIRTKYAGDTKLSNFAAELSEYTNLLAGKKAKVDRAFEDRFGRRVYNAVETIRRRTGANMIGANVSSALTNFIPITQSLATTEKKAFVKGLSDTLANVVKNDGFVQQSDFLTKRIGSDPLYRTNWDKITDKSMWLMKTFDSFTSQAITRGKYHELIGKGLSHEKAIKQADEYASRLIADRSKGSMPTLFNSKTFGILSQFQLEVNNQVSFLFKDLPKNSKNKAALASSMGQILLYSYLYNNLYEKAVGRRPAFDPIGIAFQAKKDYTNDNLSKGEATQNLTTNVLNTLPFTSIMSGGRFPVSAGVPNVNDAMAGRSSWTTELTKPLTYLGLPAGGGQLKKTYEGLTVMNKNPLEPQGTTGSYKNGKLQYPVENSAANNTRAALFGKYSLPESNEFYDNKRKALSDKQTKLVELNPESYDSIIHKQQLNGIKAKIKAIQKDENLSAEQKQKKLLPLFQQLQGR